MNSPVSVLLPVYNGEATVRRAIESALAQDYKPFELIIVDNASKDGTAGIIAEYAGDERVSIVRNEKTLPRLENFRRVFDLASAESRWYKFLGDDDEMLPGCLAEMVAAGEQYDNVGLVCSYYYNGNDLVTGAVGAEAEIIPGPQILKKMLTEPEARSTIFSPASVLISPEAYNELGGFRTDLLHADAELFYRILNRYDLAYVHKALTRIGYHGASGQALSTLEGDTFREAYLIRFHHLGEYENISLTRKQVEGIKYSLVKDSTGFILACLARGEAGKAWKHLMHIPPAALYYIPLSAAYFIQLAVKKMIRREPIKLLNESHKGS